MFLDFQDESLTGCLEGIISGLLPHANYSPETFGLLYPTLKSVLSIDDTRGLYYIFYTVLDKYMSLAASLPKGVFEVKITQDKFSNALGNNLPDLILDPKTMVTDLMAEEGKTADINIPTVQQEVMGVLYEKSIALYQRCFEMEQSMGDAMSRIVDLKDILRANLIMTGIGSQQVIMATGLYRGRKRYIGPNGWLEYMQALTREVSEMDRANEDDLVCDGLDIITRLDERNQEMAMPLAEYGVPQLDDFTPMLKHRLMVLVAKENTGKTQVCIHLIAKLIRAGVKPFFACGESPKGLMFNSIVASYLFQEYNMVFPTQYLSGEGYEMLNPDDKQTVDTAKARVISSGLVISNNLSYDTVQSKITYYHNKGCEAFFIDHSQSLRGRNNRKISDLVTGLALDCRELKNTLPIYICITSHPSTGLKDLFQREQTKDMQLSPTAQSAAPSQEADELFILNDTDYLKTQNLLEWIVYKRRGAVKPRPFYILKRFDVSSFVYDSRYQGVSGVDASTLDGLVSDAIGEDILGGDDDDDDVIELDY